MLVPLIPRLETSVVTSVLGSSMIGTWMYGVVPSIEKFPQRSGFPVCKYKQQEILIHLFGDNETNHRRKWKHTCGRYLKQAFDYHSTPWSPVLF